MNYQPLMIYGAVAVVVGILASVTNFVTGVKNSSLVRLMVVHVIAALVYGIGGIAFLIGLILYFIHIAKS